MQQSSRLPYKRHLKNVLLLDHNFGNETNTTALFYTKQERHVKTRSDFLSQNGTMPSQRFHRFSHAHSGKLM